MEIDQVCARFRYSPRATISKISLCRCDSQSQLDAKRSFLEGLYLFLEFEDRPTCVGEVMPLVGWHRETITQARAQLIQFLDGKKTLGKWKSLYPSVEFALSSALIFKKETSISSPVNALLFGDVNSVIEHAQNLYQEGSGALSLS